MLHSDVGQTLPWYFPLQPSYWHRGVAAPAAKHPLSTRGFPAQDGEVWPSIKQPCTQFQQFAGCLSGSVGFWSLCNSLCLADQVRSNLEACPY